MLFLTIVYIFRPAAEWSKPGKPHPTREIKPYKQIFPLERNYILNSVSQTIRRFYFYNFFKNSISYSKMIK